MTGINILPENTEKKKTHTQMKRCSPLYAIKEMQNNHSEVSLQIYKITKIKKKISPGAIAGGCTETSSLKQWW